MKRQPLAQRTLLLSSTLSSLLFASSLLALPVDLAAPPGGLGPTSDQGAASHWVEMVEIDFGSGMTFPLRMSFLSSREEGDGRDFGPGHWRTPLHDSRLMRKKDGRWPLLLPCGKVMGLFPKAGEQGAWATADEEWIARPKGANTLVTREDGWELEFNPKGNLIRLKDDNGRILLWTRDADGSLRSVAEFAGGKLLPPAYSVTRDPATRRVKSLRVNTRFGTKEWRYRYDASDRLTSIAFPDTSVVTNTYGSREDGHPWISITGRNAIATTLTWHKDNGSLLHDGVWNYDIQPQPGNNPIMRRIGPHGELEIHHDDALNHRTLFTAAEGTQTIKQRVKTGPAKGKLESITRIVQKSEVGASEVSGQKLETLNLKPETQVLYSATYDSRGLLETETDALGHKTTHAYTLHGSSIHTGIKTHTISKPLSSVSAQSVKSADTTQEFDKHGNLIASTNALGHTFRQEYDAQNRLLKTTGPDGAIIESLTYAKESQIATRTDALGATTTYGYDQNGNRTSITDALGNVTKHEYDLKGNRTATTDALGHTTRYEYDAGGRLAATILPEVQGAGLAKSPSQDGAAANQSPSPSPSALSATRYTYDSSGRKLTTTAPDGTVTEANTYDALGRATSRTDALGNITRFEYEVNRGCATCSAAGQPTRIISPDGRITERVYDVDRHLLSETLAAGTPAAATTKHSYDLAGNRLSTTDPLGRVTRFEYDAANRRTAVIHPDQTQRTFAYQANGLLIAETDELGLTTKREHDAYGNLIAVTDAAGNTNRTIFGSATVPVAPGKTAAPATVAPPTGYAAAHRPTGTLSAAGVRTQIEYDLLGHRIALTKAPGTPEAATTRHEFDAVGNEIASITNIGPEPQGAGASSSPPTATGAAANTQPRTANREQRTVHTYDARRRRITTTDALNRTWRFVYNDAAGPSGPAPCCGADPTSNTRAAEVIHPDGSREQKTYNAQGQLIATTDAKGDTVKYGYDAAGRLVELTDANGHSTKWRYDARGKLAAKTYPDNTTELYEHDAAGQMTSRVRPDGTSARYTYNDRGRLLKIEWSDGKTENSTFAYDKAGHLTLAENKSATIQRRYNDSGRLVQETQVIGQWNGGKGMKAEVGYEYDADGRLAQLTYPDQTTVSYRYNERGELREVLDSTPPAPGSKPGAAAYTRRPDGKITQLALPNGTVTTKTYDAVGRLSEIKHVGPAGNTLFSETSRYDLKSRRTARVQADGSADLFAYDPAGQVTAAAYGQAIDATGSAAPEKTENSEPRTANWQQTFEYDPAGNRLAATDGDTTTKYTPNAANQYTAVATGTQIVEPQFDKLGNLLHDDKNTYTWDADIHLLSVATQSSIQDQASSLTRFAYDALHRRVARLETRTANGEPGTANILTFFVTDGWNVIAEYQSSPELQLGQRSPTAKVTAARGARPDELKLTTTFLAARHTWGEDVSGSLQGAGGIGGLLASKTANSEPRTANWFAYDSNGNVICLTDAQGKESARYRYDAFGKTILAQGPAAQTNRYQFSTKPIEVGSGLAYYGFRYYSPELGRWISFDPSGISGGIHILRFVTNSSINTNDILGLNPLSLNVEDGNIGECVWGSNCTAAAMGEQFAFDPTEENMSKRGCYEKDDSIPCDMEDAAEVREYNPSGWPLIDPAGNFIPSPYHVIGENPCEPNTWRTLYGRNGPYVDSIDDPDNSASCYYRALGATFGIFVDPKPKVTKSWCCPKKCGHSI